MVTVKVFAVLEFIHCAEVRALGLTVEANVQVYLGVTIPDFPASQWAEAIHAALDVEVFDQHFDGYFTHGIL